MAITHHISDVSRSTLDNSHKSFMGYQDQIDGNTIFFYVCILIHTLQTQSERTSYRYNNTIHAFATIAKEEGFRGFYKGLGPSLIGISHVAVQFPLYEKLKVVLRK